MQRKMGEHSPMAVARASGYGMISLSCSYAASAMAKSLFVKGADFVASFVFKFASIDLVIELGVVLVVLMVWQFAVGEFVGGVIIMIVLLTALGGLWLRGQVVVEARARLTSDSGPGHGPRENTAVQNEGWGEKLRSKGGWADAATYTMADLTILRRELVIGYAVAGFLTILVPVTVWNTVILHGHGFWTSAENVIVGPFIAIAGFVCSIGNVPLAAALWKGGIPFGGVVSFIFADLVPTVHPTQIAPDHFSWDCTTYLNIIFLMIFGVLYWYWAYRNRERLGGGHGPALDPVCGMQVETASAPASTVHSGDRI